MDSNSNRHSSWLDLARWTAALFVVNLHVWALLVTISPDLSLHPADLKFFPVVEKMGDEAVVIFFVLSGYLVGGSALRSAAAGKFAWRNYAASRIGRIYTVLLPALIVGACFDIIGSRFFDFAGLYSHAGFLARPVTQFSYREQLTLANFIGSAFLLNGVLVSSFGTNGPLWSLAFEWWYYVLFGLALYARTSKGPWQSKALIWTVVAVLLVELPAVMVLWFALWLAGVLVAILEEYRLAAREWLANTFFLATVFAVCFSNADIFIVHSLARQFVANMVVAMGFSVALLFRSRAIERFPRLLAVNAFLARFSYSTYAAHFPFLILVASVEAHFFPAALGSGRSYPLLASHYFIFVLLAYSFCFLFSRATESHTRAVKEAVSRALRVGSAY
jgi:peptidoglycan/LPS O-acetylase OafA/YrhL